MMSLKNYRTLKASSIMESVIAITIISICILVAFMVYINVISQNKPTAYFKALHQVEKLYQEAKLNADYEDDNYKYSNYSISKNVTLDIEANLVNFRFDITTADKSYSVKKVAQMYEE